MSRSERNIVIPVALLKEATYTAERTQGSFYYSLSEIIFIRIPSFDGEKKAKTSKMTVMVSVFVLHLLTTSNKRQGTTLISY